MRHWRHHQSPLQHRNGYSNTAASWLATDLIKECIRIKRVDLFFLCGCCCRHHHTRQADDQLFQIAYWNKRIAQWSAGNNVLFRSIYERLRHWFWRLSAGDRRQVRPSLHPIGEWSITISTWRKKIRLRWLRSHQRGSSSCTWVSFSCPKEGKTFHWWERSPLHSSWRYRHQS